MAEAEASGDDAEHPQKFTSPGAMVVDPYTGTGVTAKGRMMELQHCKYTSCDSDGVLLEKNKGVKTKEEYIILDR